MSRVLSGVQPTGQLHLGNYLGAIRQWIAMQDAHECLFCVVDLHAITADYDHEVLRKNILHTAATYLACGIDPKKSTIFVQSKIPQHAELAWFLSCLTPLGWLNRMTQFKEKAGKQRDNASLGLYRYPVLMAADILLYKSTHVPVGEDQKQHLELARDIAGAFNRRFAVEFFPLPEPLILGAATRVMSLRDGTKKMSKSDPSDYSRIHLTDSADLISQKLKKAKSDAELGINYDAEKRPEVANLLNISSAVSGEKIENIVARCAQMNFSTFKQEVIDLLVAEIEPISKRIQEFESDPAELEKILAKGAENAANLAEKHLAEIKKIMGF